MADHTKDASWKRLKAALLRDKERESWPKLPPYEPHNHVAGMCDCVKCVPPIHVLTQPQDERYDGGTHWKFFNNPEHEKGM